LRLAASWSVFERRRSMTRPSLVKERWAKSIAASSERRKAKPTRTSARSRRPKSVSGQQATIRRMSLVRSGALPSWAVPMVRRMAAAEDSFYRWIGERRLT
jgi:hypothetical protein